jgi:Mg-chelatase subunit ChlD
MASGNTNGRRPVSLVWIAVIVVGVIVFMRLSPGRQGAKGQAGSSAPAASSAQKGTDRPFAGPGYVLQFSKDFNPGANAVDDLGLSVVIAVDASGSMGDAPAAGGGPKYKQAATALGDIVSFLEGLSRDKAMEGLELKVALLSFNDKVSVLYPLTKMDKAAFADLRTRLADPQILKPGGKTAIGATLEKGAEILAGSETVMKSLIVVSDGENTAGIEPQDALTAINENRNSASTVDLPVYTRGSLVSFVGFDVGSGIYSPLSESGARVESAADQAQLKKALTDILVADISKLEAAQ